MVDQLGGRRRVANLWRVYVSYLRVLCLGLKGDLVKQDILTFDLMTSKSNILSLFVPKTVQRVTFGIISTNSMALIHLNERGGQLSIGLAFLLYKKTIGLCHTVRRRQF